MPEELDTLLGFKSRPEPAEDSVLAKLVPVHENPALVLYGPSKAGKTRLIAWEGATLAKTLNRRMLAILTESNVEISDIKDVLYACMYHRIACEVLKLDSVTGVRSYVKRIQTSLNRTLRKGEDLETFPQVIVIDSLTALSELVMESLSDSVLQAGGSTLVPYVNPAQTVIVNPIRRILNAFYLNGYFLMVAHEMQTRGEPYNPAVPVIKAKPRYTGASQYKEDLEIYFARELPEALRTCKVTSEKGAWRKMRGLVVVWSRRHPESEGRGVAISMERAEVVVAGATTAKTGPGSTTYVYVPEDMASSEDTKEIVARPLIPRVTCGPKYAT